jgi:16S rRNA (uracil1498-N3)-methyltransferase
MMPRVFWDNPVQVGETVVVSGDDGHHFARVLRAKVGEQLSVAAAGLGYLAVVRGVDAAAGSVELEVTRQLDARDPFNKIYLIQALAKADKVDGIVQRCTEVGVAGVLVYESARSVVRLTSSKRSARVARWNKVAKEAAIQCQRDTIPLVDHASTFAAVYTWLEDHGPCQVLLLDEAERAQTLRTWLQATYAPITEEMATIVVVGPEGGWTDDERRAWSTVKAQSITLGPRILRTETAGVVAIAAVLYEYGDLGG